MAEATIPQRGRLSRPEKRPSTRELRGIALFEELGEEFDHLGGKTWSVPSAAGRGVYVVDLAVEPESCTCRDYVEPRRGREPGEPCKHVYAAEIAHAKTAVCCGCRNRFERRELTDVGGDNHDGMAALDGQKLCGRCCRLAGVLR